MSKVWGSFSILLVLAMLAFLVPAAVLLGPMATVVEAANVTEEVTATFILNTVGTNGAWRAFTSGSGGSAPWRLEQFTRQGVNDSTTHAGSGFREYSNYSGSINWNGTNGTIRAKFNMWCFNTTYPSTPKYNESATCYGFMFGRFEINISGSLLYCPFVCDLDGSRNFNGALGKGLLASNYNSSTGIFAGHEIMGSFSMTITNASYYSGTFNLRNYPPDEIRYQGITHAVGDSTTGGRLKSDTTDRVAEGLNLVWFNQTQGDYHTERSGRNQAGLEEGTPAEEGWMLITSGPIGSGGRVANSRTNFVDAGQVWTSAEMEGVVTTRVYVDDTNATTKQSSTQGWIYQTLMLDMAHQTGTGWKSQYGYMLMSFDMPDLATGDYVGGESFGYQLQEFRA